MSIKELRHLARNLGAADEMPRGVVEKGEVVAALAPILRYEEARRREKDRRGWFSFALKYGLIAAAVCLFSQPLLVATSSGRAAFAAEYAERVNLAEYAWRAGALAALVVNLAPMLAIWVLGYAKGAISRSVGRTMQTVHQRNRANRKKRN
ncbi:hypothetical protein JL721_7932 [Aureococcus anophagefferens]|nr:hypothetical protein JL721_7932 [Aureococcus anophagefferens]